MKNIPGILMTWVKSPFRNRALTTLAVSALLFAICHLPSAQAQNVGVRYLSMAPAHEFALVAGCPTNWPVVVDRIGALTVSPHPNQVVLTEAALTALYVQIRPAFQTWYSATYLPYVAARAADIESTNATSRAVLRNLFQDFAGYAQDWQAGTNYNAAQMQVIVRKHNAAFLALRNFLEGKID